MHTKNKKNLISFQFTVSSSFNRPFKGSIFYISELCRILQKGVLTGILSSL